MEFLEGNLQLRGKSSIPQERESCHSKDHTFLAVIYHTMRMLIFNLISVIRRKRGVAPHVLKNAFAWHSASTSSRVFKARLNAVQLWHWSHTYSSKPVVSEACGNGVEGSGMT
jgi:hypothetical protein